jgi:hypothetical protein
MPVLRRDPCAKRSFLSLQQPYGAQLTPAEIAAKYGRSNVPKMYAQINSLRAAIRAEGTPAIQDAWDKVEEHIDFAYGKMTEAEMDKDTRE